jgi:methylenetetrahydrofolate reductase (NADPH)
MNFKSKLDSGNFAILAEIDPPKGTDVSSMVANAKKVKGKVDVFVVPEMSNAVMRMSSLGGATILQNHGLETMMQACCRDRNRIALQADILAANGCGIFNIMAVTGEDPSFGDHYLAKAVYDIDNIELLQAIQKLMRGKDLSGIEISGSPDLFAGSTVIPGFKGQAFELELEGMKKKIDAGAQFFVTPPLFDLSTLEPFLNRIDYKKTNIIPTVLLLKSVGMARYMDQNIDHIHIPKTLISRIQKSSDKVRECISIAAETISRLKDEGFKGVMISTIGWENKLSDILEQL